MSAFTLPEVKWLVTMPILGSAQDVIDLIRRALDDTRDTVLKTLATGVPPMREDGVRLVGTIENVMEALDHAETTLPKLEQAIYPGGVQRKVGERRPAGG